MRSALVYDKVLREAMRLHSGYEVKPKTAPSCSLLAPLMMRSSSSRTLSAGCSAPTGHRLLANRAASVVRGDNRLIFAGLREHGRPLRRRRVSHRPQHRADGLFGPTANRAAPARRPEGQILVSENLNRSAHERAVDAP